MLTFPYTVEIETRMCAGHVTVVCVCVAVGIYSVEGVNTVTKLSTTLG